MSSADDGYYEMNSRVTWVEAISLPVLHASLIDSPFLTSILSTYKTVALHAVTRSGTCNTGYCSFNYKLNHGATPAEEYFSLIMGAGDSLFRGESGQENKSVLVMTCIEPGTYTLQFSEHYANMSSPLTIYGINSMYDKDYMYGDNGKEVIVSC